MNLFFRIRDSVLQQVNVLVSEGILPAELILDAIAVELPKDPSHGDVSTNVAMVLAGKAGKKPRQIAENLVEKLRALPDIAHADIAGPGFINLRFTPIFWQRIIPDILKEGTDYGNSDVGSGKKVNVEYVSANPTGPLHVGHTRGAVFGDALARLLIKAGYDVTKEYYINDAGAQIDKLAESAYLRYRQALGETVTEIPEGLYPGEYLVSVGESLKAQYGDSLLRQGREQWLPVVRHLTVDAMMAMIREDLRRLGIEQDVFTSELELTKAGLIEKTLMLLEQKGLIYEGVLEPPKGKAPEDWEPRPQTLFRATWFGDDVDRPIKKSDGSWTYFAPDIAYHLDKLQRGYIQMVNVFGADHGGYVKRLKAAVAALSDGKATLDIKLCQLVKFLRGGEPAKMSKRAGTFVTARDVLDEVGRDVLRFIMLTRKNDAPLDFDFVKVTEQSKDNPVFYVQYAHARCKSVLRLAAAEIPKAINLSMAPPMAMLNNLNAFEELNLIKLLAAWPRAIESAALAHEPHRIAFYLQELAASFHGLWNRGNEEISLRFIQKDDINRTAARLALIRAVATVIASGLQVLGVEPVEEMR